jgi:hypothetical protein
MKGGTLLQFLPLFVVAAGVFLGIRLARRRMSNPSVSLDRQVVRFRNPANGYEKEVGTPWIWCLLFGCIYFAVRGIWTHAAAGVLLAVFTFSLSWWIYPPFARRIVETHYLRRGWLPVR